MQEELFPIIDALRSFLYPFTWRHTLIPNLPATYLIELDGPFPFLLGIARPVLPRGRVRAYSLCVCGGGGVRACEPRLEMWDGKSTHLLYVCCRCTEFRIFIFMRYFVWESRALCCRRESLCILTICVCNMCVCKCARAVCCEVGYVYTLAICVFVCAICVCMRACAPGGAPSAAGESKCILAMCVCVCVCVCNMRK